MELAVRSLRIGHCLHKGLEKHVELFKSHRSPPGSQQTSHKRAAGTVPGMRHLPSSFCSHLLKFKIQPSRKIVNKSHVSFTFEFTDQCITHLNTKCCGL